MVDKHHIGRRSAHYQRPGGTFECGCDEQDELGLRGVLERWFEEAATTSDCSVSGFGDAAILPGVLMNVLGEAMYVLGWEVCQEVVRQAIRKLAEWGTLSLLDAAA